MKETKMTRPRWVALGLSLILATSTMACSKSLDEKSAKTLDEQSAKTLIQAEINSGTNRSVSIFHINQVSNGHVFVDVPRAVAPWPGQPTTTAIWPFARQNPSSESAREMIGLLGDGFITLAEADKIYLLPGTVDGSIIQPPRPKTFDRLGKYHMHLALNLDQLTGNISGTWLLSGNTPNGEPCPGSVKGQAEMDMTITIRFLPGCLGENWIFASPLHVSLVSNSKSTPHSVSLIFPSEALPGYLPTTFDLSGPDDRAMVIKWYTYGLGVCRP
jgi:hypothetical protein